MITEIFVSYEAFLDRKDKSVNGVSKNFAEDFAERTPDIFSDNETNYGCWNCRGCRNCWECKYCRDCKCCRDCNYGDDCTVCYNCSDCYKCDECNGCYGLSGAVGEINAN